MLRPLLALALALPLAATLAIQAPPNFAGTWVLDPSAGAAVGGRQGAVDTAGGGRGGGLGLGPSADSLVITQTADTLTVDEHRAAESARIVYRLDGKPASYALSAGRSAGAKVTASSRWQGNRLITTITLPASGTSESITYEESRWIESDGTMVIEVRRPGQPNMRRSVYRRKLT
jgi:hypothetical protein